MAADLNIKAAFTGKHPALVDHRLVIVVHFAAADVHAALHG